MRGNDFVDRPQPRSSGRVGAGGVAAGSSMRLESIADQTGGSSESTPSCGAFTTFWAVLFVSDWDVADDGQHTPTALANVFKQNIKL